MGKKTDTVIIRQVIFGIVCSEHHVTDGGDTNAH
jgi:hypothetical protein